VSFLFGGPKKLDVGTNQPIPTQRERSKESKRHLTAMNASHLTGCKPFKWGLVGTRMHHLALRMLLLEISHWFWPPWNGVLRSLCVSFHFDLEYACDSKLFIMLLPSL
jgi:hypothetical protein